MRRIIAALGLLIMLLMTPTHVRAAGQDIVTPRLIFPWGQCTWYAATKRMDIAGQMTGNAWNWANAAEALGMPTGSLPQVGALAVYQPGIHGADRYTGHVAYVESVDPDGWHFLLSESNGYLGLGRIDEREDVADQGVRFIF